MIEYVKYQEDDINFIKYLSFLSSRFTFKLDFQINFSFHSNYYFTNSIKKIYIVCLIFWPFVPVMCEIFNTHNKEMFLVGHQKPSEWNWISCIWLLTIRNERETSKMYGRLSRTSNFHFWHFSFFLNSNNRLTFIFKCCWEFQENWLFLHEWDSNWHVNNK